MKIIKKLAQSSKIIEFLIVSIIVFSFDLIFAIRYGFQFSFIQFLIALFNVLLVFAIITFIKNNKARYIAYVVYALVMFTFFLVDSTLYLYKQDVTSFVMLMESVRNTMKIGLKYDPIVTYGVIIWILILGFLISSLILLNKVVKLNQMAKTRYYTKRVALLMITFLGLFFSPFTLNAADALTFKTPADKALFIQKFGSITYHMKDVATYANNSIMPIFFREDFKEQIDENFDPTPADQSSLYGLLEDRNIIMIQCETCEEYAYSRTYTPNYYRLYDEGVHFNNFYSAAKSNYTYDAELKALTSMMYFQSDNVFHSYGDNQYHNALPHILAEYGYSTNAFHNYERTFFNRDVIYPNMGFEQFYADESLPIDEDVEFQLDSVMFETFQDLIVPEQDNPFFSFIITVTPHGPHNKYREELSEYYDILALDSAYDDAPIELLTLMAAQMDFDKGLGIMLDDLETKNLLDQTTILIYSDHKNYSDKELTNEYTPNSEIPYEIQKVPFLIYDQLLGSGTSDLMTSQYDITPTIFDLLGISYIQYYYYGQSMFLTNRTDSPIIFLHTSWINYENTVMLDEILSGNDNQDDYLVNKQYIYGIIDLFEMMFKCDYFKDKITYIPN